MEQTQDEYEQRMQCITQIDSCVYGCTLAELRALCEILRAFEQRRDYALDSYFTRGKEQV